MKPKIAVVSTVFALVAFAIATVGATQGYVFGVYNGIVAGVNLARIAADINVGIWPGVNIAVG